MFLLQDGTRADEYLARAEEISDAFTQQSHLQGEVIIDDRMSMTIGRRQVDADRLGYPYIVVVGVKVNLNDVYKY